MNKEKLFKAIQFAARAHDGQKRKGKNPAPYIAHPVFVGMELLRLGCDEDTIIAGFLHDTLEDTSTGRNAIKEEFGDNVLSRIDAVTEPKDPNMSKEEKRRTWEARKDTYLKQLKAAPIEARAVACVDMYANMLELSRTLKEEGTDALKIFNVDMDKKLKHWEKEIQLFSSNTDSLYSSLIPELRDILKEIEKNWSNK